MAKSVQISWHIHAILTGSTLFALIFIHEVISDQEANSVDPNQTAHDQYIYFSLLDSTGLFLT
jgi:hypothetical protein